MYISKRFLFFLLPIAITIALYTVLPSLLYIGGAYLLLLLVVGIIDYVTNPLMKSVQVSRIMNNKFSLGVKNRVTLRISNLTRYHLKLHVKDDYPSEFQYDDVIHDLHVPSSQHENIAYHLTPLRRGIYNFGDIHVRCWGVLGLIVRQYKFPAQTEIKVYPNLQAVRQYELLVKRGMLHRLGIKNSRLFGEGTEMERLREYLPDDDFRRIDWKATARHQKPIVREFETERSQDVVIMLDTARLMASPILLNSANTIDTDSVPQKAMQKLDYAINTTLMAAYVSMLKGDKVGMITFADTVHQYLSPKPGKKQFLTMLETIFALQVHPVEPDFEAAFSYLASKQQKRALIILFTDILDKDSAEGIATYVSQYSKHHLVICVTLTDSGIVELAEQNISNSKSVYQKAIAERMLQEKHTTLEILHRRGVITIDVPAHQLTMSVVNKYLELKAKSRI